MKQFEEPIGPMGRLPKQELYLLGVAMQFFDERSGRSTFGRLQGKSEIMNAFVEYFKNIQERNGNIGYIHSCPELMECIRQVGFLPLLESGI